MGCKDCPGLSARLPKAKRKHTIMRIPGSHSFFVGPKGCTRRHAINSRGRDDIENRSFLVISQNDVALGTYEHKIEQAVDQILKTVEPSPRIMIVNVFCIDDFLGTDMETLIEKLNERYASCKFILDRIHPVSFNEVKKFDDYGHMSHYSFLDPVPADARDNGVDFLGNFVSVDPDCEILDIFKAWGVGPVRQLFECKTYDEYVALAKSRFALVLRYSGNNTLREMDRLGISYFQFPACYDLDEIEGYYQAIADGIGEKLPEVSPWKQAALKEIAATRELLGDLPVVVDSDASNVPYSLARALYAYGFNVVRLYHAKHLFEADEDSYQQISSGAVPIEDFQIDRDENHTEAHKITEPHLAIGVDGAKLSGATYVVDIWHDEGFNGFHGVAKLMKLMRLAYRTGRASQADLAEAQEPADTTGEDA